MNVLLMGAPGSGKGTQADFLVDKKSFHHISTGNIFRYHLKKETSLGLSAKKYMQKGDLVPDQLTIDMVQETLSSLEKSFSHFVFDGFPRTIQQAKAFEKILQQKNQSLSYVFYLKVSDDEIVKRLTGRLYAPKSNKIYHKIYKPPQKKGFCDETGEKLIQREDDKEELVLKRLEVFWKDTKPLLDYYSEKSLLKRLEAKKMPQDVFDEISSILKV